MPSFRSESWELGGQRRCRMMWNSINVHHMSTHHFLLNFNNKEKYYFPPSPEGMHGQTQCNTFCFLSQFEGSSSRMCSRRCKGVRDEHKLCSHTGAAAWTILAFQACVLFIAEQFNRHKQAANTHTYSQRFHSSFCVVMMNGENWNLALTGFSLYD